MVQVLIVGKLGPPRIQSLEGFRQLTFRLLLSSQGNCKFMTDLKQADSERQYRRRGPLWPCFLSALHHRMFDSKGCKATGKCGKTGAFWEEHGKKCNFGKEKCPGCEELFTSAALIDHLDRCKKIKAKCVHGCGFMTEREKLQTHESDCKRSRQAN
eukprot:g16213.t1